MLQWWEKEATQKTHKKTSKTTLLKWKLFWNWKQLSNGGYHGAVIKKTKQDKIYTKKTFFILKHTFMLY